MFRYIMFIIYLFSYMLKYYKTIFLLLFFFFFDRIETKYFRTKITILYEIH